MSKSLWKKVYRKYGIKIMKSTVIKDDRKRSYVAKLHGDDGNLYILKSLYLSQQRQQFIAMSEVLLRKKGIQLAEPIPTKNEELYFQYKGYPYVLYPWIEGDRHPLNTRSDLRSIIEVLANMHRASYGLHFPSRVKIYRNVDWKKEYRMKRKQMKTFFQQNKNAKDPKKREFAKYVPFFLKLSKKSLRYLKKSSYTDLASRSYKKRSLIHGDAHQGNILSDNRRINIIDFEDVRFDFPSRDINRLFAKYTRRHDFTREIFDNMMQTYLETNPLSADERKVVMIDLLFPHVFTRLLKLKKYKLITLKEIKHVIKQEKKKGKYILKRLNR
ncbi:CotS family spore coat protein [Ammoniphilus sp. YIM 78166]|uniref:CotS family spore coat protein n=1 Tax=Ammoniphilus sp. YIM 78166 TaxID=1644106 RepID=UPI001070640F|nr:CotS family spore coat protein [Ammoniphilus sp. YIM 78166]